MRLYHYSETPLAYDPARVYNKTSYYKPDGLWVSAEEDGVAEEDRAAKSWGWPEYCRDARFNEEGLYHRTEVILRRDANVRHLDSCEAIDRFNEEFTIGYGRRGGHNVIESIDWARVTRTYQALIIAPYQWDRRLAPHTWWYYPWDCASGCVWDLAAVETTKTDVRLVRLR